MTRQNYILKIDNPCGQEWTSMTKTDFGKFCSNCSKTVVDFTQLTDNEVLQIVKQNSGKLCGRLTQDQLNRALELYKPTNTSRFHKILAGLLLVGTSENLPATDHQKLQNEIVTNIDNKKTNSEPLEIKSTPTTDSLKNIVKGMVVDSKTKEPLPFATIIIKGTKTGTTTDMNGKFKLFIPDSLLADKIYLIMNYVGYQMTEVEVNKNDLPLTKELLIVPAETAFLGLVEIEVVKKKKWWQRKKKS
ncbi:MAG: carboxypeptidase-like regulatory domain-containing protein [Bacteroidia bacterium]|nr:carboxypeptidase-like regulatory domain-containing protein [Bacteroidia bacterium]